MALAGKWDVPDRLHILRKNTSRLECSTGPQSNKCYSRLEQKHLAVYLNYRGCSLVCWIHRHRWRYRREAGVSELEVGWHTLWDIGVRRGIADGRRKLSRWVSD